MNINEFIKELSLKDKKTLSEKFTKLISETGELASSLLPYTSAPGSNDKFSDRESILDEIVDVQLVLTSILHDVGFSDEEFNEMMDKKTKKWSYKQSIEEESQFPLPFEIHITVDVSGDNFIENTDGDDTAFSDSLGYFRKNCERIGVKPIVLDLEINGESPIKDVMTSSKHFGDNRSAYEAAEAISDELSQYGYKVLRKKIETVPWHPGAPRATTGSSIPNDCYFESHIGVVLPISRKEELAKFVDGLNKNCTAAGRVELGGTCKLSRNFFKKAKDGKFVNMLTYRNNMTSKDEFEDEVNQIKNSLKNSEVNFDFEKVEVEYAIYDTNVNHDSKWLTS
jgi:NTP pyrophosphatase (non-canonical NTP hydrolase)